MRASIILTILCSVALTLPVAAGPNAGGVLMVHDPGQNASCDFPTSSPPTCATVDNELPLESSCDIWKVYAAFPPGSSPRLRAITFGQAYDPSRLIVQGGMLPDPVQDFEYGEDGWPTASGSGVSILFGTTRSGTIIECYTMFGYAYPDAPFLWTVAPHPLRPTEFYDDSDRWNADEVVALGAIGFGMPGVTPCPEAPAGVPEEAPQSVETTWGRLKSVYR